MSLIIFLWCPIFDASKIVCGRVLSLVGINSTAAVSRLAKKFFSVNAQAALSSHTHTTLFSVVVVFLLSSLSSAAVTTVLLALSASLLLLSSSYCNTESSQSTAAASPRLQRVQAAFRPIKKGH